MRSLYKTSTVFIGVFLLMAVPGYAQQAADLPDAVKESIHQRVDYSTDVGIVVGIIDEAGPRYYSYGRLAVSNDQPPDEHTVFEIGSISKVFTAILLADMAEHGELALDDPIQQYLPDDVTAPTRNGQSITLAHLSTHTSGLARMPDNFAPANPSNPYADYTIEQLYDFLGRYTLPRDIGAEYEYSNLAVGLLGQLLARRAGMDYEGLVKARLTDALGMTETGITLTPAMQDHLATGHANGIEVENWDIPTLAGAGALRSTAHDMLRFLAANMGLTETPLYAAMQTTHQTRVENAAGGMDVGLGWHIRKSDAAETVWHNGGTGGYRTFAGFVKGGNKGVVVLTNSTRGADDIGFHLLDPSFPLQPVKRSIAATLQKTIDAEGMDAARRQYHDLKENQPNTYDFGESELNSLGYQYLRKDAVETAIAIFKLNVEVFPEASNPYDSLGEAYMEQGDTEQAIANYKKSLDLNPGNANAVQMLARMGETWTPDEVTVDPATLETYVGDYQLTPSFIITVTLEEGHLMAQATGQQKFEIFPKSETAFYYKVVDAQITFNRNDAGAVESLTLHQGGQNVPGRKIK